MLRNICCGSIKTQHKSSRKIRQKKKKVLNRSIYHIFFQKIPPSFLQQIQNPRKYIICFQNPPYFDICSFLFIFYNLLLQPMKICCSYSSSSSTFKLFKTHENCRYSSSSKTMQLFQGFVFLRYHFFFKTHENCCCSSSFFLVFQPSWCFRAQFLYASYVNLTQVF